MYYNVTAVSHVAGYTLDVKFEDGTEGRVDLYPELEGPIFEPLKNIEFFQRVTVAEYGTIAWPNGADIAPEVLYSRVAGAKELRSNAG